MKIGGIRYGNLCLFFLSPLLIDGLSYIIRGKSFIGYWFKIYIAGKYYVSFLEDLLGSFLYGLLLISLFLLFLILCKRKETPIPSLNLDPISSTDQEWITDIKTRKQRGEKLNA